MTTITELLEMGAKMGLKDEELKQYVRDEQSRMRDEREKDTTERQVREEREFKLQMEKNTVIAFEKNSNINLKWKPEKNASEHQREIEELEADQQFHTLQQKKTQKSSMESTHVIETHQAMKGPKLPPVDEAKDNIDAYIFSGSKDMVLRRTEFASTGGHILVHFGCFC